MTKEAARGLPYPIRILGNQWHEAHDLLDSWSEGVLLSSKFTWATNTKTFALETPIALQLACISCCSTINYGTNAKIKVGHTSYDEHFNIANVEYYNAILGTPFLRKHNIALDFLGPGNIHMGNELIPMNETTFDNKILKEVCNLKVTQTTSEP